MRKSTALIALIAVLMSYGFSLNLNKIGKAVKATAGAARPMSAEEEYYVGRAVAARILSQYELYEDEELTEYVDLVGRTVSLHSDKPYTYGGYHFAILDSDEINAFACPGGIIFITRGMLDSVGSEDELAAVLAHEVAHINNRDGIASIKKSRWLEVVGLIGSEAAREFGSSEVSSLAGLLEGAVDDVFKTLVVKGYGKKQELKADETSLTYLERAAYSPKALLDFLKRLKDMKAADGGGLMKTHPHHKSRIRNVKKKMPDFEADESFLQVRNERFGSRVQVDVGDIGEIYPHN
jgi:predicted Zn-dependent protease